MKYFIIEGKLNTTVEIDESVMNAHIAYSQKAIEKGVTLITGLKEDMSGGVLIMKANSLEEIENYLNSDPLKTAGSQEYRILEFTPHYTLPQTNEWFER
ncbi:YciI family protein [Clostridium sp. DSM 100503]|uniref:YciI family protein n=1 Tax=Clostridium sp. DSM 100503 TaxID=2963282 RepID=UPI00214A05FB|nr:YciI family protein [Clostridium sp. DSM 100503]MCR1949826.1 YciI family protein [Clostridium sp. DSM 100503]